MFIYLITNNFNQKKYVGYTTTTPAKRFSRHCTNSRIQKYPLARAIAKYGKESFTVEQLDEAQNIDELKEKEKYWIALLKPEYNLTEGGDGVPGYRHTDEWKIANSLRHKGRKLSDESKQRISNSLRGRKLSIEHVEKIRDSKTGQPGTFKGRNHLESSKQKMRVKRLEYFTEERRQSLSEKMKSIGAPPPPHTFGHIKGKNGGTTAL